MQIESTHSKIIGNQFKILFSSLFFITNEIFKDLVELRNFIIVGTPNFYIWQYQKVKEISLENRKY